MKGKAIQAIQYAEDDWIECQRRGAFFFQHRARIGLAGALATALRYGRPPPASRGRAPAAAPAL